MTIRLFGLTGGVASGKSAVAARFRERGLPVLDADRLAREVVEPGTAGLAELVDEFGEQILKPDGELDRPKLGAVVFSHPAQRARLEEILHPKIRARTQELAEQLGAQGHQLACYEAALLVEKGQADRYRPLVVVAAPQQLQIERLCERDGLDESAARARLATQLPLAEKVAVADYTIENTGTLAQLHSRADEVLAAIRTRYER